VKRYSRAELVAFLRRVDARLTTPEVREVIGGAAAVVKYGASTPTKDTETWNRVPKAVQDAADAVGAMGQGVPLVVSGCSWSNGVCGGANGPSRHRGPIGTCRAPRSHWLAGLRPPPTGRVISRSISRCSPNPTYQYARPAWMS
jgi:hypothetical protein